MGNQCRDFLWRAGYTEIIESLPPEHQLEMAMAVIDYGTYEIVPELSEPFLAVLFNCIRLTIEKDFESDSEDYQWDSVPHFCNEGLAGVIAQAYQKAIDDTLLEKDVED